MVLISYKYLYDVWSSLMFEAVGAPYKVDVLINIKKKLSQSICMELINASEWNDAKYSLSVCLLVYY